MPVSLDRIAAFLLALVFAWAAGGKLTRFDAWRELVARHRISSRWSTLVVWGTPLAEMVVGGLLLSPLRSTGAVAAIALLLTFSAFVLVVRKQSGRRLPCGCFGRTKERDYRIMLLRNALLTAVAVLVVRTEARVEIVPETPTSNDAVPFFLAVLALVLLVWVVGSVLGALRERQGP